jgi:hypothetical protein
LAVIEKPNAVLGRVKSAVLRTASDSGHKSSGRSISRPPKRREGQPKSPGGSFRKRNDKCGHVISRGGRVFGRLTFGFASRSGRASAADDLAEPVHEAGRVIDAVPPVACVATATLPRMEAIAIVEMMILRMVFSPLGLGFGWHLAFALVPVL